MSYGYNKYSSTMSSRGRGFNSRGGGSYRGRGGGGGNEWGGGSTGGNMSGRGGYSSSRGGRFKYSTTSYDSRSKYTSGGSERYSSRGGRGEHSNSYKRPRDSYSARDDHRSSSDSTRKRMRTDSYQGGGSGSGSQRYSSYGGSSTSAPYDDNKGSSSSAVYEDKRQSERASSYHRSEDRHSASRSYAPPPPPRISEMAPPPTQRYTSSRGRISHQSSNYRGRISTRGSSGRGGGFHRVSSRSDVLMVARKRTLHSLDYRRKLLGSRSRDYIQRMRMTTTKLRRSSGTTRLTGSKKDSGSGTSVKDKDREMAKAINAEFSDDDEDEDDDNKSNWDDEEKPHEHDDEEEVEEEEEKKNKEDKRKKEKQDRERQHTEDEEEKDDDLKEEDDQKRDEDEDEGDDDEERDENDKVERDRAISSEELPSRRDGRKFIKLKCPHCAHHSVTFKEYSLHLFSGRHSAAMRRIASRHKATLTRMRVLQRQEQRRVEARDAARGTLPSRTMFCAICKLNYRSLKAAHQLSESHRQMKRFLTPFCRVCRIQFRSPMLFETHMCSLDHIKRKSALKERMNASGSGEAEADSSAPEEDDKEVNLDNFMTLDSVGDVDEDEGSNDKKKDKVEGETTSEAEKKSKGKQMIKVGAEYIKRVEVQYCELCKIYLPRSENTERAVALHCSTRSHLKRYVRDNDDKALRRQAERIHLQSSSSSSSANVNSNNSAVINSSETVKTSPVNSEPQASASTTLPAATIDNNGTRGSEYAKIEEQKSNGSESEKNMKESKSNQGDEDDDDDYRTHGVDKSTWDDVDKDLGDILRENEAAASKSSDDEESRYDRFRNSEKKQQSGKEKENDKSEVLEEKAANNKIKELKVKLEKTDI
ncbi:zinc finger CCCH domain-containing protein 13-like isoform X2 [Odontomachus brunneus]|uniref:zinc finger CCCH domain-containing protein 13-like isoform X2 n=1 Tax=Odontomachus brunneus TaxID=486640 RepID=UPI0013F19B35|nr:zinc finger CCCH domain-containing protein 13-like isoform X2 [Odontomachus brunneus]